MKKIKSLLIPIICICFTLTVIPNLNYDHQVQVQEFDYIEDNN